MRAASVVVPSNYPVERKLSVVLMVPSSGHRSHFLWTPLTPEFNPLSRQIWKISTINSTWEIFVSCLMMLPIFFIAFTAFIPATQSRFTCSPPQAGLSNASISPPNLEMLLETLKLPFLHPVWKLRKLSQKSLFLGKLAKLVLIICLNNKNAFYY